MPREGLNLQRERGTPEAKEGNKRLRVFDSLSQHPVMLLSQGHHVSKTFKRRTVERWEGERGRQAFEGRERRGDRRDVLRSGLQDASKIAMNLLGVPQKVLGLQAVVEKSKERRGREDGEQGVRRRLSSTSLPRSRSC